MLLTTSALSAAPVSSPPPPHVRGEIVESDIAVSGTSGVGPALTDRSTNSGPDARAALAPVIDIRRTPACSGNDPRMPRNVSDNSCGAAQTCPPGQLLLTTWTRPTGGTTQWARGRSGCTAPTAAGETAAVVLPTVTLDDVRRIGLPPATVNLQPDTGRVAVNLPVNLYLTAATITRTVDILGFPVTIRATPASYRWDTGDGASVGPTTDPGAPWPTMTVTHTYTEAGNYPITLTTSYTAEYDVAGLGFRPIAGTVDIASPAVPVTALAGTTVLTP